MQPFPKYITYLLIAILVIGIVCLYFAFTNKKDTASQNDLLLAMAEKLGTRDKGQETRETTQQPAERTQDDDDEIIRIADMICFGKSLNADEKKFRKKYSDEINKELEFSTTTRDLLIDKFVKGEKEFTDDEKSFYESNQEDIDALVQKKLKGSSESTITHHESPINPPPFPKPKTEFGKANPPMAAADRLKLILSFFDDGIPKTISELAPMYATATGTKGSAGSLYNLFGRLEEGTLQTQKMIINERNRVYYGLSEWFDGKKFKKEYKSKIEP